MASQHTPDDRSRLASEREALLQRLREVESALAGPVVDGLSMDLRSSWQSILDALPAHIALLDTSGRIVVVNEAWRRFAVANVFPGDAFGVGQDYLAVCTDAQGDCADEAGDAHRGIRAVLEGRRQQFTLEYPCHSPEAKRWFRMMATPIHPDELRGCVVMHVNITDRKLAEESLRASEARMRAILDSEPECVKVVSATGELLSMNPAGLRMVEADELAQVTGQPVRRLVHSEDWPAFQSLHRRVLGGKDGQLQFRMIGLRGTVRWMETHSTRMLGADGQVDSVLSITRDITARREAEERLARLQQLTQNILDSVGEGIQGIDIEGRIVSANPAAVAMLGWPVDELIGQQSHALIHHHYADGRPYDRTDCPIHKTLRDGVVRRVDDEVFHHRDGRAIPVEYVVTPVREPDGRQSGAVVCFRDISQRLADQAALALSEERFRLVARVTTNAIWDRDIARDTVLWSGGMDLLFGTTSGDLETPSSFWSSRIHPDDGERVLGRLEQCLQGLEETWKQEYRFRRTDGSYAAVVDRGFVVRDEQGRPLRMLGGMTDVSEVRALEAQLRASQRLEAVGQLTGGLAHDFNNLLTVVQGNAELLEERLRAMPAEHEMAHMILSAAQRGAALTQRLLAFARRQALEVRPVLLGELVHGMEHLLRRAVGEGVFLAVMAPHDAGPVLADPTQLENALLNLGINARDAMPDGGKLVISVTEVHTTPPDIDPLSRSERGNYVCLEVVDSGVGIPEDILPLVVEPFFTTKDVGKGTGLGLSMVYGLVKQVGGFLDIQSLPGLGTTVRIHLPRHAEDAPAGPERSAHARLQDDELPGGSERVLLVEDDALVRRYAFTQLVALGYEVVVAAGGPEALEVLKGPDRFDLLLTDVMMPGGMNGAQLAEAARALRPGLRILFSSGYSEDALVREGKLLPGVHLLAKPYKRAALAHQIRQALS